jgi:putative acetyltransferase
MTIDDFDEVHRLWDKTEGVGLNESDSNPKIRAYLKRNPGMSFVARRGTEIVGAVLCGHDGRRGYLQHLTVAKMHRRNGIGRDLVAACFSKLAETGILKCNIFVYADNGEGKLFWKHQGWVERKDLLLMQKAVMPSNKSS